MADVLSIQACEGCGTRKDVKVLLIAGLSQLSGKTHPICRECAGAIGPMTDERWDELESVQAMIHD